MIPVSGIERQRNPQTRMHVSTGTSITTTPYNGTKDIARIWRPTRCTWFWVLATVAVSVGLGVPLAQRANQNVPIKDTNAFLLPELTNRFTPSDSTGIWQGADATSSIELSSTTTLVVFSDTFVGHTQNYVRSITGMPHNSIATLDGLGTPSFYVGPDNSSFFDVEEANVYLWPVVGVRSNDNEVLILAQRVEQQPNVTIASTSGTVAIRMTYELNTSPSDWSYQTTLLPRTSSSLSCNSGVAAFDDYFYLMGGIGSEGRIREMIIARISRLQARADSWNDLEFYAGAHWSTSLNPVPIFEGSYTEGSLIIHEDGRVQFFALAAFSNVVSLYETPQITAPHAWTQRKLFSIEPFLPRLVPSNKLIAYASKVHPTLIDWCANPSDCTVISFNTNVFGMQNAFEAYLNPSVYHPIFVSLENKQLY